MKIKYNVQLNKLFIYLYGELDENSATIMRDKLDEIIEENTNVSGVVFNLSNLDFMDSTGIGMLIGRYKKIKNNKIGVFIQNPSNQIEKILQLSGLYQIMPKI